MNNSQIVYDYIISLPSPQYIFKTIFSFFGNFIAQFLIDAKKIIYYQASRELIGGLALEQFIIFKKKYLKS